MQVNYVIAADKIWNPNIVGNLNKKLPGNFIGIHSKTELNQTFLKDINPKYLFFTHWSSLIPSEIYEHYECIVFHMTEVPFGRGGSPLQNLITRGIYQTKLSAIRCTQEIDAGPVYLQCPLSLLLGSAQEIFNRASDQIEEMIIKIVTEKLIPLPQQGEPVYFKRRMPHEGNMRELNDLIMLYDYIRMLDADGYPHAYIETEYFRYEFRRATLRQEEIIADVKITRKINVEKNSGNSSAS